MSEIFDKITSDEYQELQDALDWGTTHNIVRTFADITGIEVKPYTGYQFFAGGDYVGDLEHDDLDQILKNAYIEVVDDG